MAYYRRLGTVPPKRHTQHRDPAGNLYYEELMGEEGFSSDSSLLYHRGVPSAITASAVWELPDQVRDTSSSTSSRPAPTPCSTAASCWATATCGSPTS